MNGIGLFILIETALNTWNEPYLFGRYYSFFSASSNFSKLLFKWYCNIYVSSTYLYKMISLLLSGFACPCRLSRGTLSFDNSSLMGQEKWLISNVSCYRDMSDDPWAFICLKTEILNILKSHTCWLWKVSS